MLKLRIISGAVAVVLLIGVVLSGTVPLRIAVALISVLMVLELCHAMKLHAAFTVPAAIFAALFASEVIPPGLRDAAVYLFLLITLTTLLAGHKSLHTADAARGFFLTFFVGCFMGCITKIRMSEGGAYWIWLIFIGAWVSDIFAYFSGLLFGKKKLMPLVSPKKTVAGAVGGALGAAVGFLVFGFFAKEAIGSPSYFALFFAGLIASVCGQIGDLVASVIKREHGIKDYGKIMPGHGGAMDRFDSILFVAPVIYLFMQLV